MNLILNRTKYSEDGIFGELLNDSGGFVCCTLEHAFIKPDRTFEAKVAAGEYLCKVGTGPLEGGFHALHDGIPFMAFEIQDVPEFRGLPVTGILFHIGNYQQDSEGCILLGKQIGQKSSGGNMLMASKQAFDDFMQKQGVDPFTIKIFDRNQ